MGFQFQYDKDGEILYALFRYRFLTPSLLSLITTRHVGSIRRRLRKLTDNHYLHRFDRSAVTEGVHALSKKGYGFIADDMGVAVSDLPYSKKNTAIQPHFLIHAMEAIKFVVNAELGASAHDSLTKQDFFPEWRHQDPSAKLPEQRYFIKERLPLTQSQSVPCYPDGVFTVGYPDNALVSFFLETDRASENMGRIFDKFVAYRLMYQLEVYKQRYRADAMVVLFVLSRVSTDRRINHMRRTLNEFVSRFSDERERAIASSFARRVLFARMDDVDRHTLWNEPIWQNYSGQPKALFTAPPVMNPDKTAMTTSVLQAV